MRIIKPKKGAGKHANPSDDLFTYETLELGSERRNKEQEEKTEPVASPISGVRNKLSRGDATVDNENFHDLELTLAAELYDTGESSRKHKASSRAIVDEGESVSAIVRKKEFNKLLDKGVYLLSMREHSCKEMHTKLSKKAVHLDLVDSVIEALLEAKYLSDERFTESYVRQRSNKGFGPIKIRAELMNKGIANNLIEEYLEPNSALWVDLAEQQYSRKFSAKGKMTEYKEWTKRARFLQGRGFTMDHIHSVIPPYESD